MSPFPLLKYIGKALLKHVGHLVGGLPGGVVGVAGVAGTIAADVWNQWEQDGNEEKRRAEMEALVQLAAGDLRRQVALIVAEIAAGQPEQIRRAVEEYLESVPASIRAARGHGSIGRAEDLSSMLPNQLPWACQVGCFEAKAGPVWSIAFAPDGQRFVSAHHDGGLRLWDSGSAQEKARWLGHTKAVSSVAMAAGGFRALSGSEDGTVRLWNVPTSQEVDRLTGPGLVRAVALSPDGRLAAWGGGTFAPDGQPLDCSFTLWNLGQNKPLLQVPSAGPVSSLTFSPSGEQLLVGRWDQTMVLLGVPSGRALAQYTGNAGPVWSLAISPDERLALSGSTDGNVRLWEFASGREMDRLPGHAGWVHAVAFSPDGGRILTGGDDGVLRMWRTDTRAKLCSLRGHAGGITSVAFAPDGSSALTASKDGSVRQWILPAT